MSGIGIGNMFRPTNSPPGAGTPAGRPLVSDGGTFDTFDIETYLNTFGQTSVIFAIVARISEAVAAVDWNVYKATDLEEETPLIAHPASTLWNNPNPFYSRADFVETAMQHFDLAGETDWYVGRSVAFPSAMQPLELWPIRPDKVLPVTSPKKFIEGWAYREKGFGYIPWRLDELIQLKRPNPVDPFRGIGAVAAAMIDVYSAKAAAQYNSAFFKNSAEPGGIITFPDRLPDEEYDEFIKRWREQHQGPSNAHRVAVLEGATWTDRKYTMHDMEFVEGRKTNNDFIRQAFGYPKAMLGDTENVNKASAIAGEYVFVRWIIKTRLDRIKDVLNYKLLPLFGAQGKGVKFGYQNPNPADSDSQRLDRDSDAKRVKLLTDAGYDPADVLAYVGLPPMKWAAPAKPAFGAPDPTEPAPKAP